MSKSLHGLAARLLASSREKRAYASVSRLLHRRRPIVRERVIAALTSWNSVLLDARLLGRSIHDDRMTELVMARALSSTATCIDVGCHGGVLLRQMMSYARNGTFLAFEPLPELYRGLVTQFRDPRVRVFDLALGDREGSSTFNHVVTNPGYSGLRERRYDRPNEQVETISVQVDRLDAVVARADVTRVDFIKIDVEGAEHLVLRGAEQTLREHKPVVVFEHGLGAADVYGSGPDIIYGIFEQCGMHVSLLADWLAGRAALDRTEFRRQYDEGINCYFVAHP